MKATPGPPSPKSLEAFLTLVEHWSTRLKVRPKAVHLRPMTTKWASCSTAGRVSFSYGLLRQPRKFREHVIVHELLHLRLPNHGKLFKQLLAMHAPYRTRKFPSRVARTRISNQPVYACTTRSCNASLSHSCG